MEQAVNNQESRKEQTKKKGGGNSQSRVVAAKGLGNEVGLDEGLGLVGAQVQLEALAQGARRLRHARREARHVRLPAHHAHQVDDVVGGTAKRCGPERKV